MCVFLPLLHTTTCFKLFLTHGGLQIAAPGHVAHQGHDRLLQAAVRRL